MLQMFDFAVTQLRYIKAAQIQIGTYRPDGETPVNVQTRITGAAAPRSAYVLTKLADDAGRAARRTTIATLHDACVDFAAQGLNRFRKDPDLVQRFERLPNKDMTVQETISRAKVISPFWEGLPNVGTPLAPFTVGQGTEDLTLADFLLLIEAAEAADSAMAQIDENFQTAEGEVWKYLKAMDDFIGPAITYGKDRYDPGSTERNIINAIPDNPAQNAPSQAVINSIALDGPLAIRLTFHADGGTSYDVLQRIFDSGTEFVVVAEDIIEKEYTAAGLNPATPYEFIVRGHNSRGTGPASDPATQAT